MLIWVHDYSRESPTFAHVPALCLFGMCVWDMGVDMGTSIQQREHSICERPGVVFARRVYMGFVC